ncbi:MAG: rod shape-determining protein MreD [Candidatus Omnitrophica bacterium]|nr:rod shape-determining protein MreD [Candidatus Omnitrophota bacterium]
MKKWIFLGVIFVSAILEATFLNYFRVFGAKPDLLLMLVLIASLEFDLRWALIFGLLAGFLKDTFAAGSLGIHTAMFPLWSFLIVKLSRKISVDNNFIRAALIFIISVSTAIATRLVFVYLGRFIPLGIFLRIAFLDSLYTALVFPLMLKITKPLFRS